jgi:hypothetical protein
MRYFLLSACAIVMCLGFLGCSDCDCPTEPAGGLLAPADLSVQRVSLTSLQLTWVDASRFEEGYRIDRKEGSGEWEERYATLPPNANEFVDVVQVSIPYQYRVYSFTTDGISDKSEVSLLSVQYLVDQASSGDTVVVPDGVYHEAIEIRDKSIRLISANGHKSCIIDGSLYSDSTLVSGIVIGHELCEVRGFTIQDFPLTGIGCYGTQAVVAHNVMRYNGRGAATSHGAGIRVSARSPVIHNNVIYESIGYGMSIKGDAVIANNVIAYTRSHRGGRIGVTIGGVSQGNPNTATLINNIIYESGRYSLDFLEENSIAVLYCDVTEPFVGIVELGIGCIRTQPIFVDPRNGDFHLHPISHCIDAGHPASHFNDWDGSRNDMGAYGGPDGDW